MDSSLQQQNAGLATRVALLESRLSLLDANGENGATLSSLFEPTLYSTSSPTSRMQQSEGRPPSSDLTSLLTASVLHSLANVYFSHCHRQPYAFFHENTFRRNLEHDRLPYYLLLTFVATAVRFSQESCFAGRQTECTDVYAKLAWSELMQEAFSDAHILNVRVVQAASMLGIIDYICMYSSLVFLTEG